MAEEHYRHIYLQGPTRSEAYTSPRRGGFEPRIPDRNRNRHSTYLKRRLRDAWQQEEEQRAVVHVERHGAYIEFESEPGFDLAFQSLEYIPSGIRLLNIRREGSPSSERTIATVYIPTKKRGYFLKKFEAYATQLDNRSGKPKNSKLVNSISDIRRAVLRSFWRPEEYDLIPGEQPEWIEVWLREEEPVPLERFDAVLRELNIGVAVDFLKFPERSVKLIKANRFQLERLTDYSDIIAEYRAAKQVASYYVELQNREQIEIVRELLDRTNFADEASVSVCILDNGVNNAHLLIHPVLSDDDLHSVDPDWGVHDHDPRGHGTLMAGTAAYGNLLTILNSHGPVRVIHRLESAKVLPPGGQNPKRLWGYMTSQGISRAEIHAPERRRIACMAVTSTEDRDRGRPSSWSAMVDELTSGAIDDHKRLFVLSAGNVNDSDNWRNYPSDNLTNQVHDPGQAWNALTVGAFTEKNLIVDSTLSSFTPVAPFGALSPYSTTSHTWNRKWPIKPDVVFEGGNVARGPNDSMLDPEDLKLLSTYHEPHVAQFAPFYATSAAAAQAAWMAAQIQAQYPDAWPETIRALIVHTAEWTETMRSQFLPAVNPSKQDYSDLLRICGYGVPDLSRALYCASNSLTLVSQAELQPFDKVAHSYLTKEKQNRKGYRYETKDMHLYELPWPTEALKDIGATLVTMRITLSYFIEPGPGEVGWNNRYRYPSHALRFDVNGAGESEEEFIQRVNKKARDEEGERLVTEGPQEKWLIGQARNVGSIHSDIWEGTAADLATSNLIAVYPAVGWWRERHYLNRWSKHCRYSLIVSINTPQQDVDIYTPVANMVAISTAIPVQTGR